MTLRDVLDCSVSLWFKGDYHGACNVFRIAYQRLGGTGQIDSAPLEDVERFFFEGGIKCSEYANRPDLSQQARASAAKHAENFFKGYVAWYSKLSPEQIKKLPDRGRIRSVTRHIGNALVAQGRKNEVHSTYSNGVPAQFGPDAIQLWEDTLKELNGSWDKASSPEAKEAWRDFGEFIIEWAEVPDMLPKRMRDRRVLQGKRITAMLP